MDKSGLEREYQEWATNLPSIHDGLQPLLHALVLRMLQVTNAPVGSILLQQDGNLIPTATIGLDPAPPEEIRLCLESGPLAPLLQSEGASYVPDLFEVPGLATLTHKAGLRCLLLAPLRARNQIMGAAVVASREVRHFSLTEVARFEALADRAAVAIDNTQLYQDAQRRADQLQVLAELSTAISAETDCHAIADRLANSACRLVYADCCVVEMLPEVEIPGSMESPSLFFSEQTSPHTAQAFRKLLPLLAGSEGFLRLADLRDHPARAALGAEALPFRSLLSASLAWDGRTRAMLLLARASGESFTPSDEEFLRLLVGQASIAFHNSFLLTELQLRGELAQQRAYLLETLVGSIADPVFIAAPPGVFVDMNQRALDLMGISRDEITRPLGDYTTLVEPRHLDSTPMPLEDYPVMRALAGETFDDLEMILHRAGAAGKANDVTYSFSGAPVRNSLGEIILAVIVGHDVTGERNLIRAQEELMSMASHELKTPLTLVKANAQLLARAIKKLDDPKLSQRCESLSLQVDRMQRLVELLLDISRLETGRLTVETRPVDMVTLLRETVENYNLAQPNREVVLDLPEDTVCVTGDPLRLEQVLTNLLSNATRYSPEGEEVRVDILREVETVRVSVSDKGMGISPEEIERVFDRFYQVQGSPGAQAGSMGMGLYISRGIIAAHGGSLWAESQLGEGSTFHFTLPLSLEDSC